MNIMWKTVLFIVVIACPLSEAVRWGVSSLPSKAGPVSAPVDFVWRFSNGTPCIRMSLNAYLNLSYVNTSRKTAFAKIELTNTSTTKIYVQGMCPYNGYSSSRLNLFFRGNFEGELELSFYKNLIGEVFLARMWVSYLIRNGAVFKNPQRYGYVNYYSVINNYYLSQNDSCYYCTKPLHFGFSDYNPSYHGLVMRSAIIQAFNLPKGSFATKRRYCLTKTQPKDHGVVQFALRYPNKTACILLNTNATLVLKYVNHARNYAFATVPIANVSGITLNVTGMCPYTNFVTSKLIINMYGTFRGSIVVSFVNLKGSVFLDSIQLTYNQVHGAFFKNPLRTGTLSYLLNGRQFLSSSSAFWNCPYPQYFQFADTVLQHYLIIEKTQLQAFNLTKGKLATKSRTCMKPIPPTTTPARPTVHPPTPSMGKYVFLQPSGKIRAIIIASFVIHIKDSPYAQNKTLRPNNVIKTSSVSSSAQQNTTIVFQPGTANLTFSFLRHDNTYRLTHLQFKYQASSRTTIQRVSFTSRPVSVGGYSLCSRKTVVSFGSHITLTFNQLRYQAFKQNYNAWLEGPGVDCREPSQFNATTDIVIAVAVTLVVVIIGLIVAYLVRRRYVQDNSVPYENV